ncbi:ankyrin repeat domain-containing protein [Pontiellaceae bacterium B12219]|nr:ankyrin repeat domain-containing protein [Pontiellaceae bacterium B12219]
MNKLPVLLLLLLIAGCSMEKPADTSDPELSAKWISYCQKKAEKSTGAQNKIHWLVNAYQHADQAGILTEQEKSIPDQVLPLALQSKNLTVFNWALERGAAPPSHYNDLVTIFGYGPTWRDPVLELHPEALPFFMSEAIDNHIVKYFNAHAADLKALDFKVQSPLEATEFRIRYRTFIGGQLAEALKAKDLDRIRFLIDHSPRVNTDVYIDARTRATMREVGDYVLYDLKDEELATQLVELRFELNPINFKALPFGKPFLEAIREDPVFALKTQGLLEWDGRMTDEEAVFVLALPPSSWLTLPELHFNELLEHSMKKSDSDIAVNLIKYKAKQKPLTQADYNELVGWALKYNNEDVFNYVLAETGELDIFHIDFASLAENQKLFMRSAPKLMKKIYPTMDTDARDDGVTLGRIKQAFAAENEDAGLYLVSKYDLIDEWENSVPDRTLLMDVCEAGNLKVARYLIEKRKEDLHAQTAYSENQITVFGSSRPSEGKLTPIFFAAKSGNPELIKYLVSKGANVNSRSNFRTTPLMHAVSAGQIETAKMLISLRADVNAKMSPNLSAADLGDLGSYANISTAYARARSAQNQEMMDLLKQAGARP